MRARPFIATGLFRVDAAPATSNAYAFFYNDPTLHAWLYLSGSWVSNRAMATQAALGTVSPHMGSIIYSDSAALVGDGSLIFIGAQPASQMHVWDVDGSAFYTYTVAAGWTMNFPAVYSGGWIYWPEIETTPDGGGAFDVRLRKARTDFSSPSTISTHTFSHDAGATTPTLFAFGLAGTSGLVWAGSRPGVGLGQERMIRFPLSGAAATERDYQGDTDKPDDSCWISSGMPDSSGNCVFGTSQFGLANLAYKQADNDSTGWVALWPDWAGVGQPPTWPSCASLNPAGTVLTISDVGDEASNGDNCVQDDAAGTVDGTPNAFFEVIDHPGTGLDADLYFYFGD